MTPDQHIWVNRVLSTGQLIYEADASSRVEIEVAARRTYLDTVWLRDRYHRLRAEMAHVS
jgi:hypothetical protein